MTYFTLSQGIFGIKVPYVLFQVSFYPHSFKHPFKLSYKISLSFSRLEETHTRILLYFEILNECCLTVVFNTQTSVLTVPSHNLHCIRDWLWRQYIQTWQCYVITIAKHKSDSHLHVSRVTGSMLYIFTTICL